MVEAAAEPASTLRPGLSGLRHFLELRLLASLAVLLLIAGGAVTLYAETFRAFLLLLPLVALAIVRAVGCWRGEVARPSGLLFGLLASYVGWMTLIGLLGKSGYFAPLQLALLLALLLVFWIASDFGTVRVWQLILPVFAVTLIATAGLTFIAWQLGWQLPGFDTTPPFQLGFGNQNLLGVIVATLAPILVAASFQANQPIRRIAYLVALAGCLFLVLGTQSRNAIFWSLAGMSALVFIQSRCLAKMSWRTSGLRALAVIAIGVCVIWLTADQRFERKMSAMASLQSKSDHSRLLFYRIAWDRISESPQALILGNGVNHFSRMSHDVPMREFDVVYRKAGVKHVHSEFFELWLDGGLVGLTLFAAIVLLSLRRAIRVLGDSGVDAEIRLPVLGASVGLLVWLAISLTSVSTRTAGALVLLGLLLAVIWASHKPQAVSRSRAGQVTAVVIFSLAMLCLVTAWSFFRSGRLLYLSERTWIANPRQIEPAVTFIEGALWWQPNNPKALAQRLQLAIQAGDMTTADATWQQLSHYAENFLNTPVLYASGLASSGRFAEAATVLEHYQVTAPYNYEVLVALPIYAFAANDAERMNRALEQLLIDGVYGLNYRVMKSHQVERITYQGAPAIKVTPEGGQPALTMPRNQLAGILLGRTPTSPRDGRLLLAQGFNRFFRDELNAPLDLIDITTVR